MTEADLSLILHSSQPHGLGDHDPFDDVYQVKAGDNLTSIARDTASLIRGRSGPIRRTRKSSVVGTPTSSAQASASTSLTTRILRKIIATSRLLIAETTQDATSLIKQSEAGKRQLEAFLFKVDAINFLANIGVGVGSLAAKVLKGRRDDW